MPDFDELAREISFLAPPLELGDWALYQCQSDQFFRRGATPDAADWGMTCVYRFRRPGRPSSFSRFIELRSELQTRLDKVQLGDLVRLVPHYEVGTDYFALAKAPADGGYSTAHFGDFVALGSCKPPPGFVLARSTLLDRIVESEPPIDAGSLGRTAVMRRILHNSFVRPWSELFWNDRTDVPWTLYRPCIEREDLEAWSS